MYLAIGRDCPANRATPENKSLRWNGSRLLCVRAGFKKKKKMVKKKLSNIYTTAVQIYYYNIYIYEKDEKTDWKYKRQ